MVSIMKILNFSVFLLILSLFPTSSNANEFICNKIDVNEKITFAPILLIGEIHGTNEIPKFVGDVICNVEKSGKRVWLGLEIPTSEQASIDAYLHSKGALEDKKQFTSGMFWSFKDGRSSQAVLRLIEQVRVLKIKGIPIDIFAFDQMADGEDSFSNRRERGMAEMLTKIQQLNQPAMGVVLVGNYHARKNIEIDATQPFYSLGVRLLKIGALSIQAYYDDGQAWTMRQEMSGITQKNSNLPENFIKPTPSQGIVLDKILSEEKMTAFDGYYYLGKISASPPAQGEISTH